MRCELTPEQREPIAVHEDDLWEPGGAKHRLRVWVSKPFEHPKGNSGCGCGIEGMGDRPFAVCREDHFQALGLAIKYIHLMLSYQIDKGTVLLYADTPERVTQEDLDLRYSR